MPKLWVEFSLQRFGMGVRGAALATAFSQILGAAALLITLQLVSKVSAHTERSTSSLVLCRHAVGFLSFR